MYSFVTPRGEDHETTFFGLHGAKALVNRVANRGGKTRVRDRGVVRVENKWIEEISGRRGKGLAIEC